MSDDAVSDVYCQDFMDNQGVSVLYFDRNFIITYANKDIWNMPSIIHNNSNITEETIVGSHLSKVIVELSRFSKRIENCIQNNTRHRDLEYFMPLRKTFKINIFPSTRLPNEYCITSDLVDDEDSSPAKKSILSGRNYVNSVFDSAPYAVITINRFGKVIDWNEAATNIFGWNHDEIVYRQLEEFIIPEEYRERHRQGINRYMETGSSNIFLRPLKLPALTKSGKRIIIELTVSSHAFQDDTYFSAFIRDMTDMQNQEEAFAASNESYQALRNIIEASGFNFFIIGMDNTYQYTSANLRINFSDVNFLGHNNVQLFGEQARSIDEKHAKIMREGETIVCEESLKYHDERLWFFTACTTRRDGHGGIIGLYGVAWNITEYKRAQKLVDEVEHETALRSSQLKSQFLANMSHEVRTPLNGITGMLTLIEYTELTPQQKEYVQGVRNSVDALLTIVNDILDFSKIEAGRIDMEQTDIDLYALINDLEQVFTYSADQKGLKMVIKNEIPETHRYLKGDYGRIRQVLSNIINNSIKFTYHGQVLLKALIMQQVNMVRFEVHDTGIGISDGKRDNLFKPFYQAEISTTRRFGGTGLGLSISANLVHLMHGDIGYSSKVNVGSVFWVTLPYIEGVRVDFKDGSAQVLEDSFEDSILSRESQGTQGTIILVAEDNAMNQKVAIKLLEKLGYAAQGCDNGSEAVNQVQLYPRRFGLIFMDLQMPFMDGYQATKAIRDLPEPISKIPIVALTANAMQGERQLAIERGMDDYIIKPIDISALKKVVSKWLGRQHASQMTQTQAEK